MVSTPLAFDAFLSLATSLVYLHVGLLMARRRVEGHAGQRAMRWFAVWWFGLATFSLLGGVRSGLGAMGVLHLAPHEALAYAALVPVLAGVCGLLTYLLYIYTGRGGLLPVLAFLHGFLLVALLYLLAWREPVGVATDAWSVRLVFARDAPPLVLGLAFSAILVPVLVAGVLYGALFVRAREATTRYRVGLVSLAFVVWFGSIPLAIAVGMNGVAWWPLASKLIGLGATLLVLLAYRPPRWVQSRMGVAPLELHLHGDAPPPALDVSVAASDAPPAQPVVPSCATSTTVLASPRSPDT